MEIWGLELLLRKMVLNLYIVFKKIKDAKSLELTHANLMVSNLCTSFAEKTSGSTVFSRKTLQMCGEHSLMSKVMGSSVSSEKKTCLDISLRTKHMVILSLHDVYVYTYIYIYYIYTQQYAVQKII